MAITLDGTNTSSASEPGTTLTFARTTSSGTNTGIIVQVVCYGGNRVTSGVTFNGDALTLLKQGDGNNINCSLWFRPAPDVGAFNVVVTQPGACDGVSAAAIAVHGVQQTTTADSTFGADFSSDDVTSNITTIADQCWIFDCIGDQTAAMAPGAGQTESLTSFGDTGGASYKTNVSVGANTMGWTWTGSETGRHEGAALAPAATTNISKINGLSYSTTSKVNGLAKASISKINGLS